MFCFILTLRQTLSRLSCVKMIQLMNEKEVLLGLQVTPRSAQEDTAAVLKAGLEVASPPPVSLKARMAKEQTLSCDDIRDMDDATFIASLHSSS